MNSEAARIKKLEFNDDSVSIWRDENGRHHDWPVVYILNDSRDVYVGETTRARVRLKEHLRNPDRQRMQWARLIFSDEFNKSACLDLESRLIAWLHADQQFAPLNRNDGQQNSNYFERNSRYRLIFDDVFEQLRVQGFFRRTMPQIENLNLFKLSPFKALNDDQLVAVDGILDGLFMDLGENTQSTSLIKGGPGTGKTIVAIFLLKLLRDIQSANRNLDPEDEGRFSDFFFGGFQELIAGFRIGFVVPQKSLRATIAKVFKATPGLKGIEVLSPYTVAGSNSRWQILVVDETHRLTQRGSGMTRALFKQRSLGLFGEHSTEKTAVDWIIAKSDHQIFLVDGDQSVRPADVSAQVIRDLVWKSEREHRLYTLESQMRVSAGDAYLDFARALLTDRPIAPNVSASYDLRFFDDLGDMRQKILDREEEVGLSRLVAGYAWRWSSKNQAAKDEVYDINLDGIKLRWNSTDTDWISSEGSHFEVGSIHTVQGYDLNYAGVIIGPDIIWDDASGSVRAVRESHYDSEVRRVRDGDALVKYIQNAYYVLLTRGMRGTYVYVCDPALRRRVASLMGQ